jgi:hypothetical protein
MEIDLGQRAGEGFMTDSDSSICYHPDLPFSGGGGEAQTACVFSAPMKIGVLDLETGARAGLGAFNDFFIETRDAGLCPAAGEVLVSGVRPDSSTNGFLQFFKGGEKRIIEKTLESCEEFVRSGLLIGHNLLGFDLPFLAFRASANGLTVPEWVRSENNGILDTYRLFNKSFCKFSTGMLSLQETAGLWGRKPDGDSGANFGDLWRGGTEGQRDYLRHYNMLNLIDSLCIALHSGLLGLPKDTRSDASLSFGWENAEEYHYNIPVAPARIKSGAFFHWITAPRPGLLSDGPRKGAGWGKTVAEDCRKDYPRGSGRLDAGAVIIVGFSSSEGSAINIAREEEIIGQGLAVLKTMVTGGKSPRTDNPHVFKNFTCLRLSTHGGILPKWFAHCDAFQDDRIRGLGESGLVALGKGLGIDDMRIPSYTGQDAEEFVQATEGIASHRANASEYYEASSAD